MDGEEDLAVYLLGGMGFVSEIPLPELSLWKCGAAPLQQIDIRLGSVPSSLPQGTELDPGCFAAPTEFRLALDVRAYLLGTVFAVLCHQRGLLPLHASAVSWEGNVIAFLGHAG